MRTTVARIDALQDEPGPAHETTEALARETAALIQAVTDARGALAKGAELASRRDGKWAILLGPVTRATCPSHG